MDQHPCEMADQRFVTADDVVDQVRTVLGPLFVGFLVLLAAPSTEPYASLDRDGRLLLGAATASAVVAVALCAATIAVGSARGGSSRSTLVLELLAFDATALAAAFGATALVGERFGPVTGALTGVLSIGIAAVAEIASLTSTATLTSMTPSMVGRWTERGSSTV
jgi:hypothetical protein